MYRYIGVIYLCQTIFYFYLIVTRELFSRPGRSQIAPDPAAIFPGVPESVRRFPGEVYTFWAPHEPMWAMLSNTRARCSNRLISLHKN